MSNRRRYMAHPDLRLLRLAQLDLIQRQRELLERFRIQHQAVLAAIDNWIEVSRS